MPDHHALHHYAGLNYEESLLQLQAQLERTSSFYIPVDELEAALHDLHARGWSVLSDL